LEKNDHQASSADLDSEGAWNEQPLFQLQRLGPREKTKALHLEMQLNALSKTEKLIE